MADVSLLEELDSLVVITGDKKRVGLYARAADRIRELEVYERMVDGAIYIDYGDDLWRPSELP